MRDTFLRTRTTTTVNGFALFHARQLLFLVRPQQSPESKAPGQQNETGDGGSLCPERGHGNNTATAQTPSVDPPSSKGVGSNGSRLALQSSTLESTPEEDSDTSLSPDTDGADRRARRKSTKAGCQQQPSGIDGASATITSESHNSDPLRDKGGTMVAERSPSAEFTGREGSSRRGSRGCQVGRPLTGRWQS